MRKILVTTGLPYANGHIHLGHLVENIQADIWVRWQKLQGHDCVFFCGDDAHGTPVMLSAEQQNIAPEELVKTIHDQHVRDFAGFYVEYDNYHSTHSAENKELSELVYKRLKANGDIEIKTIQQAFDTQQNMFLPDRYVKGTCPRCNAKGQYGDSCEACGATYATTDLIKPVSVISGTVPTEKESEHYFFILEKYQDMLEKWIAEPGHLQESIVHKLQEWFAIGLKPWDISRDAPYFGFAIPGNTDKYFYVWLDAPIGYIASLKNWCDKNAKADYLDYWGEGSATELYHFVGKDIIYFHALFWPALLTGAKLRKPSAIFTHGFLTVNGQKMSKSRGTFILARKYLELLNPEYLRYYFAAKLNDSIDDIDLNFDDFILRVNSDLVGKVVNIASRCAGFINKKFDNKLAETLNNQQLFVEFVTSGDKIAELYENREYSHAVREIMTLADAANRYIDEQKPWALAKQPGNQAQVHEVCSTGVNLFRILAIYLKPILPKMAADAEEFLNVAPLSWQDREMLLTNHTINKFKPLMQRVEREKIDELLQA